MIDKLKKQNAFVIVLEFALIILVVIGITYALYSYSNRFNVKTEKIGIDEDIYGDTSIDSDSIKLIPINDKDIYTNNDNVLTIKFKVRGSKENVVNNIIYDIALNNLQVDCDLLSKYLKWELIKNGNVINTGNFSPSFDTIDKGRLVLTDIQQDLNDYSTDSDNYEFRMWLSDSCQEDDITKCQNNEDQSNLLNKSISGKIEVELYTGSKSKLERKKSDTIDTSTCINNIDNSGANKPSISDGMLAVYYDNNTSTWNIADKNNSNSKYYWYNYNEKRWANAVIVKDYNKYKDKVLGTVVDTDDIVAFYVWIPRYKYKVWNIDNEESRNSLYNNGIDIVFENAKSDSGEITCTKDECIGNNDEYVTHPLFINKDIKGFWVSKYKVSGTDNNPFIKESDNYLTNYTRESALNTSLKILDYGVKDKKIELLSNLEWGTVVYLSYSKYGSYMDNTDRNIYSVYNIDDDFDEMVLFDGNLLGSATGEVGSTLDSYSDVIYRSKLFNISNTSSNYGFRNILY